MIVFLEDASGYDPQADGLKVRSLSIRVQGFASANDRRLSSRCGWAWWDVLPLLQHAYRARPSLLRSPGRFRENWCVLQVPPLLPRPCRGRALLIELRTRTPTRLEPWIAV